MSRFSLVQNRIKGVGNILDVQKDTSVGSIAVQGQLHTIQQLISELGNELFGELMRSVDVVSASNEAGDLETAKVGLDQEFHSRLGSSVRVGGFQDVFFGHGVGFKVFSFSVHFIGRNVHKPTNGLANLGTFQQDVSSVNVGMSKGKGVTEGVIDVRLSGKVQNRINLFFAQDIRNQIFRRNISLDEFEVGQVVEFTQVIQTRAVIQTIVNCHIVLRIFLATNGDVGGNET
mmetsp:Transcript_117464/g.339598  ORF Transcript_117464/g.339598 Transcript_117464/m.339598 type:complete len:231 (+) Transcript_117464:433-1125(+)